MDGVIFVNIVGVIYIYIYIYIYMIFLKPKIYMIDI
jgi:hypothetical protein